MAIIRYFLLILLVAVPAALLWLTLVPQGGTAQESAAPVMQEAEKVFNAETYTLENGLQIVVIPNDRAPVVTHMVWYKTGAADEPQGESGIAHFMEHLMFKGSEGLAPGEFSKKVRALGGNDNAFTSQDYTAYHQSIAAEHLETVMRMEAGRMRGMAMPPEEVESERLVILEERRQRTDNDPRAQFGEQLYAALFVNHPYGTPVIGWMHEMEKLTREYAKAFYDKWYAPNNAILVVSGDVTGEQVYNLAKEIYGPLQPAEVPERTRPSSPPLSSNVEVTMRHPDIRQPSVSILYRVPSSRQNEEDSLALQVLEEVAGSGSTSRLYKSLVRDQKIATGAGLSYNGSAWDDGTVTVYATPAPGVEPEKVVEALHAELRKIVNEGVREEEVRDAKTQMQDAAVYARDSLTGPAMIFGRALATGSDIDDVEYWPQRIESVTAAQVQDVAKRYLDPDARHKNPVVTGYLLPDSPAPAQAVPAETAPPPDQEIGVGE